MIRCAGLLTCELDDAEVAMEELTTQLNGKLGKLGTSTVGIVMCHTEFIREGIYGHIAKNLPFDVVGMTTSANAVTGEFEEMALSVFVMTSDTVRFKAGATTDITGSVEEPLEEAVAKYAENGEDNEAPGLIIAMIPLLFAGISGDRYYDAWCKIFPGVPLFAGMATSDEIDASGSTVFHGERVSDSMLSFVLCYGDIKPRFAIAALDGIYERPYGGTITRSNENFLYEVDGRHIREFLNKAGLIDENGEFLGVNGFVPFRLNMHENPDYDGIPVLKGIFGFDENGAAGFEGDMNQGSTFTLMEMTSEGVLTSTAKKVQAISQMPDVNGVLIFSCVTRHMLLMGSDATAELEIAKKALDEIPHMMGYVGGEFCPTSENKGVYVNRFHNYTLIALVL